MKIQFVLKSYRFSIILILNNEKPLNKNLKNYENKVIFTLNIIQL